MKKIGKIVMGIGIAVLILQPGLVGAQQATDVTKDSVEACKASAKDKITVEKIKEMVDKACVLVSKEGSAAFSKFKGKDSPFIFCGTYIWINDMKGVMRMHPMIPQLEGMDLLNAKDAQGKKLFAEFCRIAKEKGAGWVDYWWPKPGSPEPHRKISYVKLCKIDGKEMVVGCGVYDLPEEVMDKLLVAQETSKELAKETEKATAESDIFAATPQLVMSKVKQAVKLLEKYGKSAFPEFKGKHSPFIYSGTYIWVNDYNGVMVMHPIQAQMENKNLLDWKDKRGKMIFREFIKVCKSKKGSGWVDYYWPKPGDPKNAPPARKVSYVMRAKVDGQDMVVGSGIYDLSDKQIDKLVAGTDTKK
jgi:signal transduction histidine kinase